MPSRTSVAARDAGLRRVSLLTRGAVAAGVALTGAFAALAAHAFPGRSGQRAAAASPAVASPAAETTTEAPTTTPPTTVAPRVASATAAVRHPLQPPVTAPWAVVPVRTPVTAAPVPVPVHRVRPHAVSGGS